MHCVRSAPTAAQERTGLDSLPWVVNREKTWCKWNKTASKIPLSHKELCVKRLRRTFLSPADRDTCSLRKEQKFWKQGWGKGRAENQYTNATGSLSGVRITPMNTWNYNPGEQKQPGGDVGGWGLRGRQISALHIRRQLVKEAAFQRHHFSPLISLH